MRTLKRTEFGNPILRKRAKAVSRAMPRSRAFKALVKSMIATMRRTNGVGLAAPQVGKSLRLCVIETRPTPTRPNLERRGPVVMINPRIVTRSKPKASDWEGCLSLDNVRARIPRSRGVTVEYLDEEGSAVREYASGLWARIVQHEVDHLEGVLCLDRLEEPESVMSVAEFKKRVLKER